MKAFVWLGVLELIAFSNCATVTAQEITRYPRFDNSCTSLVDGYQWMQLAHDPAPRLYPHWSNCQETGLAPDHPLLFSVTHEDLNNNHASDLNSNPDIVAYMADHDHDRDFGRWFNFGFYQTDRGKTLAMSLDTINFEALTPTGRSNRNGHLFFGLNDTSIKSTLNHDIYVEFDMRVRGDQVRPELTSGSYSGHRVMLGASLNWEERSGRSNSSHYMEVDLTMTPGYSYGEPVFEYCRDTQYNRCYYDPAGTYSEGRYVDYAAYLKNLSLPLNHDGWTRVRVPVSGIVRSLGWVSPPSDWSTATFSGLYIGIESQGATRLWIEIVNYRVYTSDQAASVLGIPLGLVRVGAAGLLSTPEGVCALSNGDHLAAYSFRQRDFDLAPQVKLPAQYVVPACPWPTARYRALFRVANGGFLQTSQFYCTIPDSKTLSTLGFTQQDFDQAYQVFIPAYGLIYTGACR